MRGLSFDDVLLVPKKGIVKSRDDVLTTSWLAGDWTMTVPFVSAPMSTVTSYEMANAMWDAGGTGIIHRFRTAEDQTKAFKLVYVREGLIYKRNAGCAVGVNEGYDRIKMLFDAGCTLFCVDIAHGHSIGMEKYMEGMPDDIRHHSKFILGSVATGEGAAWLTELGADALRVGIGNGAACTTRSKTGFGVPQITAITEVRRGVEGKTNQNGMPVRIIACGGIRNSGDVVKALAAGANSVMLGRLLAGCDESPNPGTYYGMASAEAGSEYVEGDSGTVPLSGVVERVIQRLSAGVRSGISYAGGRSIADLRNAEFIEVTPSESRTDGGIL